METTFHIVVNVHACLRSFVPPAVYPYPPPPQVRGLLLGEGITEGGQDAAGGQGRGVLDAAQLRRLFSLLPEMSLFHGTADQTVPVAQSREFADALRAAGANIGYERCRVLLAFDALELSCRAVFAAACDLFYAISSYSLAATHSTHSHPQFRCAPHLVTTPTSRTPTRSSRMPSWARTR